MSSSFSTIGKQFNALSPILKFGVIGIVLVVLFLVWDSSIAPVTQQWSDEADQLEAKVLQVRESPKIAANLRQLRPQITSLGAVELPADSQTTYEQLNALVNSLLDKYGDKILDEEFGLTEARVGGKVSGALSSIGAAQELNRLAATLSFIGPPDAAAEIIQALENSPHVEALTEVRMRREGEKRVDVQLKLEAWVVAHKKSRV